MGVCDWEGGSTYKSSEVITGAVSTSSIDDFLCHWIAVKESREGGYTEAEVEVPRIDVLTYKIGGG